MLQLRSILLSARDQSIKVINIYMEVIYSFIQLPSSVVFAIVGVSWNLLKGWIQTEAGSKASSIH